MGIKEYLEQCEKGFELIRSQHHRIKKEIDILKKNKGNNQVIELFDSLCEENMRIIMALYQVFFLQVEFIRKEYGYKGNECIGFDEMKEVLTKTEQIKMRQKFMETIKL